MKKLLLVSAALLTMFAAAPYSANAQTNTLSYSNVPSTVAAGGSFTFSITLNFTAGGNELDVAGLSLWFYQLSPASGPFTLSFTGLNRNNNGTLSVFDIAQTSNNDLFGSAANPGGPSGPPRSMPLAPINNQGTGSPFQPAERTDLGAIASGGGNGTGNYFVANITLQVGANTAPGTYTISNTTINTPNVGGRVSRTNDSSGAAAGVKDISQSTFSFTVVPEPSTYALMAVGAIAFGIVAYRRRALS
ncbi:MAG: PEP-CTERM sorting domain-containing protein [Verrucomicrobiota bacterium]|nr:PEP-CTERM sorting domain-containing protein [Verrucomicrobiota bacterium]